MKTIQKQYELKSRMLNNSQNIEITDYFRFLDEIRKRKNLYIIPQEKINIKRVICEPFKDPNVIDENKRLKERLYTIIDERPLPKLNIEYLEVRDRIKNSKEKYREIAQKGLSVENSRFQDRVFNQKPRIEEIRFLRKIHKRHSKLMKNSKTENYEDDYKKYSKRIQNLILPNIYGHKDGKSEKIFQTEVNTTNNISQNEQSLENAEKMKDHNYNEISHQKQGHIK